KYIIVDKQIHDFLHIFNIITFIIFFFFQAEDGIRDFHVTGVQTCALPISAKISRRSSSGISSGFSCPAERSSATTMVSSSWLRRSEERRVGKECRSGGSPDNEK